MINKIHKLEQDIIQFKASQDIGSSSSRIIQAADINISDTLYGAKYIIVVFKSPDSLHPIITPRLEIKINGTVVPPRFINGVKQTGNYYLMDYDQTIMLGSLYYWGSVNENIFDEHTTGFYLTIQKGSGWETPTPFTVKGTLYATAQGTVEVYQYDP